MGDPTLREKIHRERAKLKELCKMLMDRKSCHWMESAKPLFNQWVAGSSPARLTTTGNERNNLPVRHFSIG